MYIKSLTVENFRNYEKEKIELLPTTNVFYGNNAQGKTNLLEAVYLFSHGRSHRTHTDSELIRFGCDYFLLSLEFCDSQRNYTAQMRYSQSKKKQIKINNIPITKLSMLMNYLNVVIFSPEDLNLIKGSPSKRRSFCDEAISQLYPKYLNALISYHKALVQKNSLLKSLRFSNKTSDTMLSCWNEQLAASGVTVYRRREEFLKSVEALTKPVHRDIAAEELTLEYQPGIKLQTPTAEEFYNVLEKNQKREIEQGSSLVGIQRDDFKICINGNEAKIFGSQGQQRTCVLSLKIGETEYIKQIKEEYPVLLLDDIMSELDINRRRYLWECITDKQVILTCTDTDILNSTTNTGLFNISNGRIIR